MNLKELYKKYDDLLLRKKPVLWVLGFHIYLPLLVVLYLLLLLIGLAYPYNPVPWWNEYEDFFETLSLIMILPTILLAIMFVIRQIKFNSRRIHVHLPYRKSFGNMLYFFVLFGLIIALPFVGSIGATFRASMSLDIEEFTEDMQELSDGVSHFKMSKYRVYDSLEIAEIQARRESSIEYVEDDYAEEVGVKTAEAIPYYSDGSSYTYELNETKDSLMFYREKWNPRYYYSYNEMDTISIDSAIKEIKNFIAVSSKYQGELSLMNAEEIFKRNLSSERTYTRNDTNVTPAFNYFLNHEAFENNTRVHREYIDKSGPFFVKEGNFWMYYMLFALGLSILLIIICSVKIVDFGWAMLVAALMPTIFGILFAITKYITHNFYNDGALIATTLLTICTLATIYVAFFSRFKPTVKRAFAIAFHCYVPILVAAYLNLIRDLRDCCSPDYDYERVCDCYNLLSHSQFDDFVLAASVILALVFTYFYGKYYRKQYIDPQSR